MQKEEIITNTELQERPLFSSTDLRRLILPLVVEQFLAIAIGMADTVMVTSVGEAAVSGVSLVDTISLLIIQVFSALATGGAVVASQYLGRQDECGACRAAKQLLYAVTGVALFLTGLCLLAREHLLFFIFGQIEPAVMDSALSYLLLTAASYPFLAIYNAGAALFRSMGNSKISMFASMVMNAVNVAGNAVFIYGFDMGAAGAGLGTLLSRVAAAAIMLILTCQPTQILFIHQVWKPEWESGMLKSILKVGIPLGLENGVFYGGKLLVASLISSLGTAAIAANAIANSLSTLPNIPGTSIGLATITVMGQCMGARQPEQGALYTKKLLRLSSLCIGAICVFLLIAATPLVTLFDLSPAATEMAIQIVRLFALFSIFFWVPAFGLPYSLRAAGDAKFTMTVSMFSMVLFRVALSYVLVWVTPLGLIGVWLAMFTDWICRSIFFALRFAGGKWKNLTVIQS